MAKISNLATRSTMTLKPSCLCLMNAIPLHWWLVCQRNEDFDMRLNFMVADWPDSAHDTGIMNHALIYFLWSIFKTVSNLATRSTMTLKPSCLCLMNAIPLHWWLVCQQNGDFDARLNFVVADWSNSAHDTWIMNHALTIFLWSIFKTAFMYYLVAFKKSTYHLLQSGLLMTSITLWIMVIQTDRTRYLAPFKGSTYGRCLNFCLRQGPLKNKAHELKLQAQQEVQS
jgi:hypothetical protein